MKSLYKKENGCKILKNAYILIKLYQIAHFHDPYMKNKSILNIEIFGPPTKNSDFSDFSGILVLFSTEISKSGTYMSSLNVNYLLELGKCFPTI